MDRMNWLNLEHLLLDALPDRLLTLAPTLDHAQFRDQALSVAAGLQARGITHLAVHLEDAADLGIALFAAWRADVHVLLPADLQGQTRERWANQVDLWLTDLPGDTQLSDLRAAPLPAAALDLDQCRLSLCT
ncbi:AMP-binding protein, partial [Pseudomonas syringae]|nr:AMP-binding protein [Pseudomonas syringae]